MENHHFKWENHYKWPIFHGYIKLPEGINQVAFFGAPDCTSTYQILQKTNFSAAQFDANNSPLPRTNGI